MNEKEEIKPILGGDIKGIKIKIVKVRRIESAD